MSKLLSLDEAFELLNRWKSDSTLISFAASGTDLISKGTGTISALSRTEIAVSGPSFNLLFSFTNAIFTYSEPSEANDSIRSKSMEAFVSCLEIKLPNGEFRILYECWPNVNVIIDS